MMNGLGLDDMRQSGESNWGPWLFAGTLFVILVFFWWLVIHSGGVAAHGG